MTSVVIAAHNEAAVIGACLTRLLADAAVDELDVTVVANGCSDATAGVAGAHPGVRVIELEMASKSAALNVGDAVAVGFPRVYLDADILVSAVDVRNLVQAVDRVRPAIQEAADGKAPLAAVPRRHIDVRGRPLAVKCYYAINTRLPAFNSGLFGRGMIALSEAARARFDRFPSVIADDLFLDSLFDASEKLQVESVCTVIATPMTTSGLIRRLVRVRRGNAQLRSAARSGDLRQQARPADRLAWLRSVVLPRPWLAPAGLVYVVITSIAAARAARAPTGANGWGRDGSNRGSGAGR